MGLIIKRTCILIAAIAALCCPSVARGETKVLERSTKKTPEWIASATEGYIVAAVQAPTIAEARSLAEQEITSLNKTLYNLQMGIKETRIRSSEDRAR